MNCQNLKQKYEELLALQTDFQAVNARFQKMKPNTVAERRAVSDELLRKQENITKFIEDNFDSILWQDKIIKSEKAVLEEFFDQSIEVPKLPKVTKEQIANWEKMGMELCYLPEVDMTEDKNFKGWKKKPTNLFKYIKDGNLSTEATKIKAGWRLIDKRPKPRYVGGGSQMYEENDILKEVISELREKNIIQKWYGKDQGSRFNISNNELQKEEVKIAFAKVLGVDPKNIRLPKAMEQNLIGSSRYPDWGDTDTYEWFEDEYKGGGRLYGGSSDDGGLSSVYDSSSFDRHGNVGFRPLVVLS